MKRALPYPFIIPATHDDIPLMDAIYLQACAKMTPELQQAYAENATDLINSEGAYLERLMNNPEMYMYLARAPYKMTPQAYVAFSVGRRFKHAYVEDLYNASDEYSLGAVLMDKVVEVSQLHKMHSIMLRAISGSEKAYERMGFVEVDDQKKDGSSILMVRDLQSPSMAEPCPALSHPTLVRSVPHHAQMNML